MVDITATKVGYQLIFLLSTATICRIRMNSMVDETRFELGNHIAKRIRCFVIGSLVEERLYHLKEMIYASTAAILYPI